MFDDIIFEKAPVKCKCGADITDFQTKQFECCLNTYRINKNNKFQSENYHIRDAKRSEQTKIGGKGKSLWLPIMIKEHKGWQTLKWTDTIYCHTFCHNCNKWWFDIEMIWIKGKLDSIKIKKRKL